MIPDAPWIRDAENNGIPANEPPICPVCYGEAECLYYLKCSHEIIGCDNCIESVDAWNAEFEGTTFIR